MRANIEFDSTSEFAILTMIEAITRLNEAYLDRHPETPGIYESGVRYKREGAPERWYDIPNILARGIDDCEGLASWRAAELRREGYDASAVLRRFKKKGGGTLYHCLVEVHTEDGPQYDDPSARLGMLEATNRRLPEGAVAGVEAWKRFPRRGLLPLEDDDSDQLQLRTFHEIGADRWSTGCPLRVCGHRKRRVAVVSSPDAPPLGEELVVAGAELQDNAFYYHHPDQAGAFERPRQRYRLRGRRGDGRLVLAEIDPAESP